MGLSRGNLTFSDALQLTGTGPVCRLGHPNFSSWRSLCKPLCQKSFRSPRRTRPAQDRIECEPIVPKWLGCQWPPDMATRKDDGANDLPENTLLSRQRRMTRSTVGGNPAGCFPRAAAPVPARTGPQLAFRVLAWACPTEGLLRKDEVHQRLPGSLYAAPGLLRYSKGQQLVMNLS